MCAVTTVSQSIDPLFCLKFVGITSNLKKPENKRAALGKDKESSRAALARSYRSLSQRKTTRSKNLNLCGKTKQREVVLFYIVIILCI